MGGKEWLYWVGGSGGVGGGGGGGSSKSSTKKGRMSGEMKDTASSASCMCAVFHLFDLYHFQFPLNQQSPSDFHNNKYPFLQEEATTSQGIEAPRNSLELDEPAVMNSASISLAIKQEDHLNFPLGIQIKTSYGKTSSPRVSASASKARSDDFSSECSSNSPGTKTPSLVARLMGLDLLPECNSPSISSSRPKPHMKSCLHQRKDRNLLHTCRRNRSFFDDDIGLGARSLPDTPRVSSSRRSDVEHHRLSLQINKENMNEEFALSGKMAARERFGLLPQDENTSPGHCAKQIVKHVKESMSRRVGLDITNTIRKREHCRRDENLIPPKKNSKVLSRSEAEISPSQSKKPTTDSVIKSPRVSSSSSDNHQSQGFTNPLKPKPQAVIPMPEHKQQQQQQQKDGKKVSSTQKCRSSRLKKLHPQSSDNAIRNKKEEPFVRSTTTTKLNLTDKNSKRTPLSSDVLNISGPTLLQVKKGPSPPPTKLPQKQSQVSDALSSKSSTQLSSNPSQSYKQLQLQPDKIIRLLPGSSRGCATTIHGGASAEYGNYIQRILKRAGIINGVYPLAKWHNPSHPIDPSIFHHLELLHLTTSSSGGGSGGGVCNTILNNRCNRKLIFQLVNELLDEILTPQHNLNAWISPITEDGHFPLVHELCKKIDRFPAANCLVLEDIDTLIDKDLRKSQLKGSFVEEESIVCEIEGEIVEWLVRETVAVMGGHAAEEQAETGTCHVGHLRGETPLVI